MASTAALMVGISAATAPATSESARFMMANISEVGKSAMRSDVGLDCSVRSFSIIVPGISLVPILLMIGLDD